MSHPRGLSSTSVVSPSGSTWSPVLAHALTYRSIDGVRGIRKDPLGQGGRRVRGDGQTSFSHPSRSRVLRAAPREAGGEMVDAELIDSSRTGGESEIGPDHATSHDFLHLISRSFLLLRKAPSPHSAVSRPRSFLVATTRHIVVSGCPVLATIPSLRAERSPILYGHGTL